MSRLAWILAASAVCLAALGSAAAVMPKLLVWNGSASVPRGLYRLTAIERLDVTDLVAVAPPAALQLYLDRNGFLPRGALLLKRVAGLPGQRLCRIGSTVTVDGVEMGEALQRDREGRPLPVWSGCRRIRSDEVLLMNYGVRDSLDGRYFGALPRASVVARAVPLLIDPEGDGRFIWRIPLSEPQSP